MTLERYNQILWATLGTCAGLGILGFGGWLAFNLSREAKQPTIIVAKPNEPKPKQDLVFCEPVVIRGTNRQLFPVAVVNVEDPDSQKTVLSQTFHSNLVYRYSSSNCAFGQYGGASRIFNVIVKDTQTGRQWLLLNQPAQIDSVNIPSEKCKNGEGPVPCGVLQWHIRDQDTNKDGVIDKKDALVVFHSDGQTVQLRAVTSHNASLIDFVWDRDRNSLLYQVRMDSNGNGEFEESDGTNILEYTIGKSNAAEPVVDEDLKKDLLSRIR
jgi:hypothetical protein